MRYAKREIECLQRLHSLNSTYEDLIQFLMQEYLLDNEELKAIRISTEKAKMLQSRLADLSTQRKIQLLEYEWTILPVERIKITLVTANAHKEISVEL